MKVLMTIGVNEQGQPVLNSNVPDVVIMLGLLEVCKDLVKQIGAQQAAQSVVQAPASVLQKLNGR